MPLKCIVLGSGGTYPTVYRNTTSIYFKTQYTNFLLDAGEGFQKKLLETKESFFVDFIVISHFHYDHFSGLLPYIRTLNALDRKTPLRIYSPDPEYLIRHFNSVNPDFNTKLSYKIQFIKINCDIEYLQKGLYLKFIKVNHSVTTFGVLFESIENTTYDKQKLNDWGSPIEIRQLIKEKSYVKNDVQYHSEDFIQSTTPYFRVIYSADTSINSSLWDLVDEDTLLIHECTHFFKDDISQSVKRLHTHYSQLIDLKIKCPVILFHMGAKITRELVLKIKKPKNYYFSYDGMCILFNSKKKQLKVI